MSITTYAELKTAVSDWMHVGTGLDSYIPDFISATENMIAYGLDLPGRKIPPLRVLDMTTRSTASISTQYVDWPTDALGIRSIRLNTDPVRSLDYLTPEQVDQRWAGSETGTPVIYSIVGRQIQFAPTPSTTFTCEISYYKKYAAFSADADYNWLLTNHPFVYLYGALGFAHTFTYSGESDKFYAMYASLVEGLNGSENRARYSGTLRQRARVSD